MARKVNIAVSRDNDLFKRTKIGGVHFSAPLSIFNSWLSFVRKGRPCTLQQIQETYSTAPYLGLVLTSYSSGQLLGLTISPLLFL